MIVSRAINQTASGTAVSGAGILAGVVLAGGSATATLTVYDNTTGSGTVLVKVAAMANDTVTVNVPVSFSNGVYLDIAGLGASATVFVV